MESVSISGPAIAVSNSNLYWGRLTSGAMERPFHGRLSIGSLTAKSAEGTALRCRHAMIALANSNFLTFQILRSICMAASTNVRSGGGEFLFSRFEREYTMPDCVRL